MVWLEKLNSLLLMYKARFNIVNVKARFNIRKQKWSLKIYIHNTTVDKCNSKIKI